MTLRTEIQNEAKRMVMATDEAVTVKALCTSLNISRKTFYKYYQDKYDLFDSIIHEELFESLTYISQIPERKEADSVFVLNTLYHRIYENREFYRRLNRDHNMFLDCIFKENYRLNQILFQNDKIDPVERKYQIYLAAMAGRNLVEKWMADDFQLSSRKVSELFYKYVTRAWVEDIAYFEGNEK